MRENGKKYFAALDFLCESKNQEVLENLIDFFTEENDEYEGVLESLKARIGANFTLDQLIEVFYKKFDSFAEKCLSMCKQMSMWCIRNRQINDGHWDRFRKMFNAVKSKHSAKVLEEVKSYFKYNDWSDEEKNMVYALEEDMKSW